MSISIGVVFIFGSSLLASASIFLAQTIRKSGFSWIGARLHNSAANLSASDWISRISSERCSPIPIVFLPLFRRFKVHAHNTGYGFLHLGQRIRSPISTSCIGNPFPHLSHFSRVEAGGIPMSGTL